MSLHGGYGIGYGGACSRTTLVATLVNEAYISPQRVMTSFLNILARRINLCSLDHWGATGEHAPENLAISLRQNPYGP